MKIVLLLALLYAAWLGMMAVHEAGHVVHAVVSGGAVERVVIPLLGFSRTDVSPNPHPAFVAWGGPVWGALLPLALWGVLHRLDVRGRRLAQFFAGFCLIANGAYIGLGWMMPSGGDAADLRALGVPVWAMVLFALITVPSGLWLWHRLGPAMGLRPA